MAHVASNSTDNTPRPLMDRLTHSIIKETSKNLKYYIDVKRRENAFVLNSNPSVSDSIPVRERCIYGISKKHPTLTNSYHPDKDLKGFLPNFQQKQIYSSSSSPEKQMCREELNFHMRSYHFSPREYQKFSELHLRPSYGVNRDSRPRSTFKPTRYEQDQLIDDTANILAAMVKTRRTINDTSLSTQPTSPIYISRNVNPSPRQSNEQLVQPSITDLRLLSKRQQCKSETPKTTPIMQKSKVITKGFLCEYKISITTGNCNGASTTAPIRMKFFGTNGCTNFHELIQSETHRTPFSKDQTDLFTIQTYHVGQLMAITIGHDRKDMRSSWFLSKVSIDDPIRNMTYNIPCNAWLSIKSNDQKTMRDFQVVSMISLKKQINSNEHRTENESQSDHSTTITDGTLSSNGTNPNEDKLLTDDKRIKKYRKQQHVSIRPTTVATKSSTMSATTNNLSQLSSTTIETHFNQDKVPPPSESTRRIRSPILSPTTTSDTEIEGHITNRSCSTTTTPSPTLNKTRLQSVSEHSILQTKRTNDIFKRHSIDHTRPPARLEQRNSPLSMSPERPNKSNAETNENNAFSFFE